MESAASSIRNRARSTPAFGVSGRALARVPAGLRDALAAAGGRTAFGFLNRLVRLAGPESALARTWQTAGMVGLIVIVMAVYLVLALV